MRIAFVVPGSGGSFYCGNCVRDASVIGALRRAGHEVTAVPMYLPLFVDGGNVVGVNVAGSTRVFYGAVNVYLKQKLDFFKRPRPLLERMFDSPPILKLAARAAGSVRAARLGEMTLSMLRGEEGRQASELEKLVSVLSDRVKPDVVHLSNALLLGLVRCIKEELRVPVVCFLQDEDSWIDETDEGSARSAWRLLGEKAPQVDMFVPVSRFYEGVMKRRLCLTDRRVAVVHPGVNPEECAEAPLSFEPPVVGFLGRNSASAGLGLLVDAFIKLKKEKRFGELKLRVTGGGTPDDRKFMSDVRRKLETQGASRDVEFFPHFDGASRARFFTRLSCFSAPALREEAFGVSLLEALACGVPVVQPRLGAFPEIVEAAGGGVLYAPNDAVSLAEALASVLLDPAGARELGRRGRRGVRSKFDIAGTADKLVAVYEKCINRRQWERP